MKETMAAEKPPSFRLPDATGVGRVTLQVADLERSLAFYRDVIGFREIGRAVVDGIPLSELGRDGSDHALVVLREKRGARPVPRRGLLGLYHFALLLPDRASLGRFVRHAAGASIPFGAADHLVSEALYLTDPDGLQMEIYADRPRAAWREVNGELAMATDPLDLHDLVTAGGEDHWTGVPAGSTIGHMHFYVGDLTQAAAFYHRGLGFDVVVRRYPGALFVAAGGYHHHVGLNTWAAGSPVATDADARLLDWQLVLPDRDAIDRTAQSVADAGYQLTLNGPDVSATDPWGITVRLVAPARS